MILDNYADYDGLGLAELVRRKEVSPRDLVDSAIDVIEHHNGAVNCVPQVLHDMALAEIRRGLPNGPFRGVPFLVKEFGTRSVRDSAAMLDAVAGPREP